MTSSFNVHDPPGYEQLMGRWSQKLAPLFIDFAGLADGEKIPDVGCGTGSLTFALAKNPNLAGIAAIDCSPAFVEAASLLVDRVLAEEVRAYVPMVAPPNA